MRALDRDAQRLFLQPTQESAFGIGVHVLAQEMTPHCMCHPDQHGCFLHIDLKTVKRKHGKKFWHNLQCFKELLLGVENFAQKKIVSINL